MSPTNAPTAPPTGNQLMGFLSKACNLMEVPNLLNAPDELHPLYQKIRKCPSVERFSQSLMGKEAKLRLSIREGEIINHVVRSRIKSLFKGFEHTFAVYGRDVLVNIKLPA